MPALPLKTIDTNQGDDRAQKHESAADENQEAHAMTPLQVETASRWLAVSNVAYIVACLFAVFATFGIVYFSRKYTNLKEAELAQYQKEADSRIAVAAARAAEANALAQAAKADAEASRSEQEASKTERARLELRLHDMERSHSKLLETNAVSEEKLRALEDAARPRTISAAQRAQIAALLRPFAGQKVPLYLYAQEQEAHEFFSQVTEVLKDAGLHPEEIVVMAGAGRGFGIAVHDETSAPTIAVTLQHAFRSAGIALGGVVSPDRVEEGKWFLFIGAKGPNP